jgi:hypothetical protein
VKRFILFALLLFVGTDVLAQGSAPSPSQLWKRNGPDTLVSFTSNRADSIRFWDSLTYWVWDANGGNGKFMFRDTTRFGRHIYGSSGAFTGHLQTASGLVIGLDTVTTWLGAGIFINGGELSAYLGNKIDDTTKILRWLLRGSYINPTTNIIARHFYKGRGVLGNDTLEYNAITLIDSELVTLYYAATHLGGKLLPASDPTNGTWPIYNTTTGTWQYGSTSGGGGGTMTVDTTYGGTNNPFLPTGIQFRSGRYVAFSKSSVGDTIIPDLFHATPLNYGSNAAGTQWYPDTLYTVVGTDTFFMVSNNGTTTTLDARGENNAFRINKPTTIAGDLVIASNGNILSTNTLAVDVSATGGLNINTANGKVINFGLSPTTSTQSFYIIGDTLSGVLPVSGNVSTIKNITYWGSNNGTFDSLLRVNADSLELRKAMILRSNVLTFFSQARQIARKWTRVEGSFTTTDSTAGTIRIVGDPGLGQIDSMRQVGQWYSAFKPFDSLSRLSIAGASGGTLVNFTRATGGSSYTVQWPNAGPSGRKFFGYEGGVYGFFADSNSGSGGNTNVKWDTCKVCALATGKDASDSAFLFGKTQRIASIRQTAAGVTTFDAGQNTTAKFGPTGIAVLDSVLRAPTNIYFGTSVDSTIRLYKELVDSVKNAKGRFRVHYVYVPAGGVYGRPKAPSTSDSVYLMEGRWMDSASGVLWTWTDSSLKGTDTDYAYQDIMFPDTMNVDSITYIWIAGAADSTGGMIDTIKVYKRYSTGSGLIDSVIVTNAARKVGTTATRAVFAVNGASGVNVARGEIWTIKFRNKFPTANGKVRVFGLAARGLVR